MTLRELHEQSGALLVLRPLAGDVTVVIVDDEVPEWDAAVSHVRMEPLEVRLVAPTIRREMRRALC